MFCIFSNTVQAEQMVSGSNMLSLGGPVFAYMKGKMRENREGGGKIL